MVNRSHNLGRFIQISVVMFVGSSLQMMKPSTIPIAPNPIAPIPPPIRPLGDVTMRGSRASY